MKTLDKELHNERGKVHEPAPDPEKSWKRQSTGRKTKRCRMCKHNEVAQKDELYCGKCRIKVLRWVKQQNGIGTE